MAHIKQADADRWPAVVKVRGGMSYRQTTERFTVSRSVIVRLKQRMNQTAKGQECLWKRLQEKIDLLKSSPARTARTDTDLKPPPNLSFVKVQVNL
jgi:hypothetical protein